MSSSVQNVRIEVALLGVHCVPRSFALMHRRRPKLRDDSPSTSVTCGQSRSG
ncbi:hypothetical protein BIW11_08898 [Tropilaelaps mercedesae]|uniref:Uncharacterized protein n=1 Tax=Tropilaelaps mercedesae TaxID=418985 RepID=A0A1V9XMQ3_9ACAR|nr:hypothetical protein BIW11_08898 [Tropilaelaps mercedesae]